MTTSNPYSNLKIVWHPEKLDALRRGIVTAPINVLVQPTNRCDHRCFYCSYMDHALGLRTAVNARDEISWEIFKKVLADIAVMKVKSVILSGGGEPLLYPKIKETLVFLKKNKIDFALMTNGQRLKGEIAELLRTASWVRISLDACRPGRFSEIRSIPGKNFLEIRKNIKQFAKEKSKSCELGINFVVHHLNADQVYAMARFAKALGVNHVKYTARITKNLFVYHEPFKNSVVEQIHKAQAKLQDKHFKIINKYEEDFHLNMVFERSYRHCPIMQINTVISADSKVYMCHDKAYVPDGQLGDLKKQSLRKIWFSRKTRNLFKNFDVHKHCQHHCVYDERNILINEAIKSFSQHINFI